MYVAYIQDTFRLLRHLFISRTTTTAVGFRRTDAPLSFPLFPVDGCRWVPNHVLPTAPPPYAHRSVNACSPPLYRPAVESHREFSVLTNTATTTAAAVATATCHAARSRPDDLDQALLLAATSAMDGEHKIGGGPGLAHASGQGSDPSLNRNLVSGGGSGGGGGVGGGGGGGES